MQNYFLSYFRPSYSVVTQKQSAGMGGDGTKILFRADFYCNKQRNENEAPRLYIGLRYHECISIRLLVTLEQ